MAVKTRDRERYEKERKNSAKDGWKRKDQKARSKRKLVKERDGKKWERKNWLALVDAPGGR